ncbi:MAG: (Fe-S)-binding protein [Alphaproteobacteria bacterium]|nr:(Fe-S)-binding protein [Alphaproteobacteria bacterium]
MGTLTDPIKNKGLAVFDDLPDSRLITQLNSCVHCGLCAETCIYYLATGDERMIPARKVDLVASIYRRYHTVAGKLFPAIVKARDLDEDTADEMVDLLYGACTMCGRCNAHCSIGIDIGFVIRTGRTMLSNMGMVPATLQSTVDAALVSGNNMSIPKEEFIDTLKWMEEELVDELNDPQAVIPLDQPGKRVLYTLNPREPKFFPLSIAAMAKIFYAAGESWTLSTRMYDVTNYAYFSGNINEASIIANRLWDEMSALKTQALVLAECGHGSAAFRWESPNYLHQQFPFEVMTSVEWIARYLRQGKIKLDPSRIKETVTLHDPCNLVRNGGIIHEQRVILRQCVENFVEMNPCGSDNHCCGGGGGQLAMSEYNERRMKIAGIKADQIRKTGAKIVVTPCHNCVDQLSQINFHYKLNVQIKTIAEVVADALILP